MRGGAPYIDDASRKERDAHRRRRRQLRQRPEEGFLPEMLDHHQPVPASHRPPSNLPKTSTKPAPQSTEGSLPSAPAPAKAVPRARPTRCRALDAHHRHRHRADLTPSPSPGLGAGGHRRHAAGTAPRGDNEQAAAENPRRTPGSSHARPDPASASLPAGHRSTTEAPAPPSRAGTVTHRGSAEIRSTTPPSRAPPRERQEHHQAPLPRDVYCPSGCV